MQEQLVILPGMWQSGWWALAHLALSILTRIKAMTSLKNNQANKKKKKNQEFHHGQVRM